MSTLRLAFVLMALVPLAQVGRGEKPEIALKRAAPKPWAAVRRLDSALSPLLDNVDSFPIRNRHCLTRSLLSIAKALPETEDPLTWRRNSYVCYSNPDTFSHRTSEHDLVLLVRQTPGQISRTLASQEHEIVEVGKVGDAHLAVGDLFMLPGYRRAKPGDLFLLVGSFQQQDLQTPIAWRRIKRMTRRGFDYIMAAPSPREPTTERLLYFVQHLESSDAQIDRDAFAELTAVQYESLLPLAGQLPREQIRGWLADPQTSAHRLGLYGIMLGLCGQPEDAELLSDIVAEPSEEFREGFEGALLGYLFLSGEQGLDLLDESRLMDGNVPFCEVYAAMQATRFMWRSVPGRISNARLQQSMRLLLDRPKLADLCIADLTRWKDWSVQDRLRELYEADAYDIPSVKRAIVYYMFRSSQDLPEDDDAEAPPHVEKGKAYLEELRALDPLTVRKVEDLLRAAQGR